MDVPLFIEVVSASCQIVAVEVFVGGIPVEDVVVKGEGVKLFGINVVVKQGSMYVYVPVSLTVQLVAY